MGKISIVKTADYEEETMKKSVDAHFSLLGLENLIRPGMKIVIKPNLLLKSSPDSAVVTRVEFVRAIILKLKELGAGEITIAESPGGLYNKARLSAVYSSTEYTSLCDIEGVNLNFDFSSKPKSVPNGKLVHNFELITPIADADFIINICKLKTHALTGISGSVKNLFGCIPGLAKPEMHFRFQEQTDFCNMLIDLSLCVVPNITFVDAVWCMEGNGPSGGTPIYSGLTLASTDIYNLDRVLLDVAGFSVNEAPIVKAEIDRGLSSESPDSSNLVGDGVDVLGTLSFKRPDACDIGFDQKAPKPLLKPWRFLKKRLFQPKPSITKETCIGCGRCSETCPMKAIKIVDKKARISYNKCIHCFCCQEMCPQKAISAKRFFAFKM